MAHAGEVFGCAFTPDSHYVLSCGWDGYLKVWDVEQGSEVISFQADTRPLSTCAVAPDGTSWLSGSMHGLLGKWSAETQNQQQVFLAHTRPISALRFSPDGTQLATASWDCSVAVWPADRDRDGRILGHHKDIVAGCCFTPDGHRLVSWSYDRTVAVWDLRDPDSPGHLEGHADRVLAGGVSPDARWLATGGRDRVVKLWSLQAGQPAATTVLHDEARACLFLLDTETLLLVDAVGTISVHSLPDLTPRTELSTNVPVQCAELSPSGGMIALGGTDGRVRFVRVDGFDRRPLAVTAQCEVRDAAGAVRRFFGGAKPTKVFLCTCPACRHAFEMSGTSPGQPAPCPSCGRAIRVCLVTQPPEEESAPAPGLRMLAHQRK
jgi:WD40 repeat protein